MGKIVFCEDDPMIRKLIQAALRNAPHEVHIAADGEEGLALIGRIRPDVVFSDVSMPRLDGYQLQEALRASPETANVPIVFMTASVQRAQIDDAIGHGAAGVLTKPFTTADLRARVADFMAAAGR